ncbi:HD-GYP domain-containing protein [Paenibacillus sp. CC-CFT747]|nr:HD-GYP domain-containing protein [Paenibacillus sp. CC-CFT747]
MAIVSTSQLKPGDSIQDNVMTTRGNLLMEKGRMLTPREIAILQAFLIPNVSIVSKEDIAAADPAAQPPMMEPVETAFYEEYQRMLVFLKKVFAQVKAGQPFPILEIRLNLEKLIGLIDDYNILAMTSFQSEESDYPYHNSLLVALTSYKLAGWSGFPAKDWIPVALGGLFHDIGNSKVDPVIFEKKTRLTESEMEEMRKHTIYGYQFLKNVPAINEGVKLCALQHHEKEDGSGYPLRTKGDKIHPYAKIVAIADMFHAMTSNRAHKKAASPYLVLEELLLESFGKLEPTLVQTFINRVTSFHNGTLVRLSDNRIGEIVFSDRNHPTRPWVNVEGSILNLSIERRIHIKEVVASS